MRTLSIEAATRDSGLALFKALRRFRPELDVGDNDQSVVSVELGSEGRTVEVLATLDEFVNARSGGTPITLTVSEKTERPD